VEPLSDRPWFVVKIVVLALLVIILIPSAIDGISIFRAKSHLTHIAQDASAAAATAYATNHDATAACTAAAGSIHTAAPDVVPGDHSCKVDTAAGTVLIKLHSDAGTILIGHIPYVRRITVISARGTSNLGA
jgi:Flp pilus assembly protein TadG